MQNVWEAFESFALALDEETVEAFEDRGQVIRLLYEIECVREEHRFSERAKLIGHTYTGYVLRDAGGKPVPCGRLGVHKKLCILERKAEETAAIAAVRAKRRA